MKAYITVDVLDSKVHVELSGESPAEDLLIKLMELQAPTWELMPSKNLRCSLNARVQQ